MSYTLFGATLSERTAHVGSAIYFHSVRCLINGPGIVLSVVVERGSTQSLDETRARGGGKSINIIICLHRFFYSHFLTSCRMARQCVVAVRYRMKGMFMFGRPIEFEPLLLSLISR